MKTIIRRRVGDQIDQTQVEPKNNAIKQIGIAAKISQKASSVAKWCFSKSRDLLVGAAAWTIASTVLDQGKSIKLLYASVIHPELFQSDPQALKTHLDNAINLSKKAGVIIPNTVNTESILKASCPKEEFYNQFSLAYNHKMTHSIAIRDTLLVNVVILPLVEEVVFRGLLQDVILKRLVGKIINKISPQHASLVDSKIYAAFRILLTAFCYSTYHNVSRGGIFPDKYVDLQLNATFISGVAFGALKEITGLSASLGGHAVNNFIVSSFGLFTRC